MKHLMMKKIILSLFMLVTTLTLAQQGSSSAYSFYGVGDRKPNQTIENRSMGGIAIQVDSTQVNFQNPSAYGNKNEYSQVILSILNNAKDVLIQRDINKPEISIDISKSDSKSVVTISDNARGIEQKKISDILNISLFEQNVKEI